MHVYRNNTHNLINSAYDLNIVHSAYVEIGSEWNGTSLYSPFSRLYFVSRGGGEIVFNEKTISLESGSIYLIPMNEKYTYSNDSGSVMKKLFFHINITKADGFDLLNELHEVKVLPHSEKIISSIIDGYLQNNVSSAFNTNAVIYGVLAQMLSDTDISTLNIHRSENLARAIDFIKNNLSAKLTVNDVSDHLYISKSSLNAIFRKELGQSVGSYIDDLLFFHVIKTIHESNLSIHEISEKFKFCDQFYFSRRFKQKYHVSPKKYMMSLNNIFY